MERVKEHPFETPPDNRDVEHRGITPAPGMMLWLYSGASFKNQPSPARWLRGTSGDVSLIGPPLPPRCKVVSVSRGALRVLQRQTTHSSSTLHISGWGEATWLFINLAPDSNIRHGSSTRAAF